MSRWRAAGALLALLLSALPATAQSRHGNAWEWGPGPRALSGESMVVMIGGPRSGRQIMISVDHMTGSNREGGYGYSLLELENQDRAPHRIEVAVEMQQMGGWMDFSCQRTLSLAAGAKGRVVLPLPTGSSLGALLRVSVDTGESTATYFQSSGRKTGLAVLCATDRTDIGNDWQARLDKLMVAELRWLVILYVVKAMLVA